MGWGKGNVGCGYGGGLNFKVVGNPQPASPKENTIWVNTDVPITSYIFSATEPEAPADGKNGPVWISTGTSSTVEFNALKKNGLKVYPISAKQYIDGAWVDKTAKSYQNGEWVNWAKYYIQNGKLVETLSGVLRTGQTVSMSQKGDYVEIKATGQSSGGYAYPSPINVTDYRKLVLYVDILSGVYDNYAVGPVLLTALNAANVTALNSNIIASEMANSVGTHILECNISEYDGNYYIGVNVNCGDSSSKRPSAKIYDFYLA